MILSILVILVLLGVATFQYTQGLFPATIAAVCAAAAALGAFAFHEPLARAFGGPLGSYADAVALAGLFAVLFVLLRFVVDNFFPGNVRYPVAMDKIGAAVMGLVCGFFPAAILALVASQLPLGARAMMYSRYATEDGEVPAPRNLAQFYAVDRNDPSSDIMEYRDAITAERLGEGAEASSLWLPVDAWFVSLAASLSGPEGSLTGPTDFASVYPGGYDGYADAAYGRRIGLQAGAKQAALYDPDGGEAQVRLADEGGLFRLVTEEGGQFAGGLPQTKGEDWFGRNDPDPTLLAPAGKELLVVRLLFDRKAAGEGGYVRFGPSAARLVAGGKQYFAAGTIESSRVAVRAAPDDYLVSKGGVDLFYEVDADAFADADAARLADGAFLEFKELARIPLGGRPVRQFLTGDQRAQIERKVLVKQFIADALPDATADLGEVRALFDDMRDSLPAQAPDAAEAEEAFLAGQAVPEGTAAPEAADGDDSPAADAPTEEEPADDDAEQAGTAGILGGIKDGARDRNDEIEGGE